MQSYQHIPVSWACMPIHACLSVINDFPKGKLHLAFVTVLLLCLAMPSPPLPPYSHSYPPTAKSIPLQLYASGLDLTSKDSRLCEWCFCGICVQDHFPLWISLYKQHKQRKKCMQVTFHNGKESSEDKEVNKAKKKQVMQSSQAVMTTAEQRALLHKYFSSKKGFINNQFSTVHVRHRSLLSLGYWKVLCNRYLSISSQ